MSKKRSSNKVFEYYVLYNPESDNPKSEIISKGEVLALDENKALMIISRNIPEKYIEQLEDVEIAIRPF